MPAHRCPLDLDPIVTGYVHITARRVARLYHLNAADEADLRQEIYLEILQSQHLFDPTRATWGTFIKVLTRTARKRYLRKRLRERRELNACAACGTAPEFGIDGLEALLDINLPDGTNPRLLLIALWEVYPRLTPLLQHLCRLALAGYDRDEMAVIVGMPRHGVEYRMNLLWRYLTGDYVPCPKKSRVLFQKNA